MDRPGTHSFYDLPVVPALAGLLDFEGPLDVAGFYVEAIANVLEAGVVNVAGAALLESCVAQEGQAGEA